MSWADKAIDDMKASYEAELANLRDRIEALEKERDFLRQKSISNAQERNAAESKLAEARAEALEPIIAEIKTLKTNFGMAAYVSGYNDGRNDALSIVEEAAAIRALKSGGANG